MLLPYYSIGSDTQKIESCLNREFIDNHRPGFLVGNGMPAPVIYAEDPDKIDRGICGMQGPRNKCLTWIRSEGIIKKMHLRQLIRKQRCLVPANGFFVEKGKQLFFIYSPKIPVLTFGAIWDWYDTDNSVKIHFSILTSPATSMLKKISARMPLLVNGGNQRRYLKIHSPLMDITRLFRHETSLELNGYPIDPGILQSKNITRSSFRPTGPKLIPNQPFPEKQIKGNYYLYMQS